MAGAENIKPYDSELAKKEQVAEMFNNISKRYDLLNHLLSLNIDRGWRRKVVSMVKADAPTLVLDVATGTADLAIALAKGTGADITGADISEGMLEVGRGKVAKKGLSKKIVLELGDSENLPYADATFDAITVAFGVRNFQNLHNGLKDMMRVLKPGGQLVVLEFSQPRYFPFKQLYWFFIIIMGSFYMSRKAQAPCTTHIYIYHTQIKPSVTVHPWPFSCAITTATAGISDGVNH